MIDELVVKRILKELSSTDYKCFSSEAQLRDAFAIALVKMYPNFVVYPEYTQPKPKGWRCSEDLIHFDLLVEDNDSNETVLFEFKYKTKAGDFMPGKFRIYLRDQSDTTNGRYAIWRDIYRVETFVNLNQITKGFIVFITNNRTYYTAPKPGTYSEQFSIEDGRLHNCGRRDWNLHSGQARSTCTNIQPAYRNDMYPLITENDYYFSYEEYSKIDDMNANTHTFKQLVLPIHSSEYNNQIESELRKIGKKNYVKYYSSFKNESSKDCKQELQKKEGISIESANTIVSSAKRLFSQHKNIEALRNIIASSKVDKSIREEAAEALQQER